MAYSKQTWDTTSYVNPTRMNHIEQGIYDNSSTEINPTGISFNPASSTYSTSDYRAKRNGNVVYISMVLATSSITTNTEIQVGTFSGIPNDSHCKISGVMNSNSNSQETGYWVLAGNRLYCRWTRDSYSSHIISFTIVIDD